MPVSVDLNNVILPVHFLWSNISVHERKSILAALCSSLVARFTFQVLRFELVFGARMKGHYRHILCIICLWRAWAQEWSVHLYLQSVNSTIANVSARVYRHYNTLQNNLQFLVSFYCHVSRYMLIVLPIFVINALVQNRHITFFVWCQFSWW